MCNQNLFFSVGLGYLRMEPNHFRLSPRCLLLFLFFFAFLINDEIIHIYFMYLFYNHVSIDGKKLTRDYVYCYVLTCRLYLRVEISLGAHSFHVGFAM